MATVDKTHAIAELLREPPEPKPHAMLAQAVRLGKPCIGTRESGALPEGAEIADAYDAKDAIDVAEATLALLGEWGRALAVPEVKLGALQREDHGSQGSSLAGRRGDGRGRRPPWQG